MGKAAKIPQKKENTSNLKKLLSTDFLANPKMMKGITGEIKSGMIDLKSIFKYFEVFDAIQVQI